MIYVTRAEYAGEYKLSLSFSDNRQGIADLEQALKHDHRPIFRELTDIEKFKRFRVDADTVVWENGLDLAPEYLYQKLNL